MSADRGGLAAGRDIVGILPEQLPAIIDAATGPLERLNEQQHETIEKLEQQLDVTRDQIIAFFRVIGESSIGPDDMLGRLVEVAERHKQLLAQAVTGPNDDAEVARLKTEARSCLEIADLERADELLIKVETAQLAASDRLARDAAATRAQRGAIAMTRLRYQEAGDHFAAAAARVPAADQAQRLDYMDQQAEALYRQGDEFGDNQALAEAVGALQVILGLEARERVPLYWAATQNNLGNALQVLGERGDDAALRQAVDAYEAALLEYTREREPLLWAAIQNNLGNALRVLGQRGDDAALRRAADAFEAALLEYTREREPLNWAATQNNLGTALGVLGERGDDAALRRAVDAFEAALPEYTRERQPLLWAATQNNLGVALQVLGERGDDAALRRAVDACEAALLERTRERVPLDWAAMQNNLGDAPRVLGERGDDAALQRAVAAYEAALDELSQRNAPVYVTMVEQNLARASALLP